MPPTDPTHLRPRGERALVQQLAARLPQRHHSVPFGDDMAVLLDGERPLLGTVDMLMDGVDFISAEHDWAEIGYKALAVSISDCAAMAVEPVSALVSVALQDSLSMEAALRLFEGVQQCAREFDCDLVGGDTNSWEQPTVIDTIVTGRPPAGLAPIRRDGAHPGDAIFLTGPTGGSLLGRHLHPQPRVRLALELAARFAPHALIDVSDGVALDLSRLLAASRVGADLEELPLQAAIHPDARRRATLTGRAPLDHMLHDGEDFELLVVLPASADPAACQALGLLPIGRIVAGGELTLRCADGTREALEARGWEHFA